MTRRRYPDLELTIEDVTPDIAEEWLEKNLHNRKVSDRLVEIYAETMEADEWVLNGEPIIFDKTGKLQSGQHRLLAVVASGVTIRTVVVRGADPAAIYSLDSGRKRRTTDALTLRGEKNVATLANALVWHWRYEHRIMDRSLAPTTTHLLRLLDETPDLREWVRAGNRLKRNLPISPGLIGALTYRFNEINPTDTEFFLDKLFSGEDLTSDNPIWLLRRWLTRTALESRKPPQQVYAAIIVKAWNAYREHTSLRALRWSANEAFPEII